MFCGSTRSTVRNTPSRTSAASIITTNHKSDGIFLPADDRRHFVAWSDLDKSDFTDDYWKEFWQWYGRGGLDVVAHYLANLDLTDFNPKAPPPKTEAFYEIVNASRTPEDAELADALDELGWPSVVTITAVILASKQSDFIDYLKDRKNSRKHPAPVRGLRLYAGPQSGCQGRPVEAARPPPGDLRPQQPQFYGPPRARPNASRPVSHVSEVSDFRCTGFSVGSIPQNACARGEGKTVQPKSLTSLISLTSAADGHTSRTRHNRAIRRGR